MGVRRIFILVGHPARESSAGSLADEYESGAREAGHEVRRMNLADLAFDPILHEGYKEIQPLEPDLVAVQENMKWAEHIVILYPNWWCTMPALLKGMFDRMYLPGFAFRFKKDAEGNQTIWWEKMLTGRSAHVVVTTGTHPWVVRFLFGDYTNEIKRGILGFGGISPVRVTTIGPCDSASERQKERWRQKFYKLGKKGA